MIERPTTLGDLREAGYRPRGVREEIRENLVSMLRDGRNPFPGVLGFERTVLPALQNALLARHDVLLLGLRGQAKTRILRALVNLLDDELPIIAGSELNESPFAPFTRFGKRIAASAGADLPLEWLPRAARYREKLATPDVTIADLIGDIDPVKAATEKRSFSDEEVIHYGIVPRTNRGIFAINELPDLQPRIQVGLLNILEERDLQIRGFPVRIPLDIFFFFSANPEDYTNRGNIITPLKDRIDSQILTHYPKTTDIAREITRQEAWTERGAAGARIVIPESVRELVEQIAFSARDSELVDQSSGVSARMPISALEILHSNLERRAITTGDREVYPRLADLAMVLPAITGKVEMVYEGEQQGSEVVARKLVGEAVTKLFEKTFPPVERAGRSVAADRDRERRGYGEIDPAMRDDGPARRRKGQRAEEPEPPRGHGDPEYEAIVAWFMDGNKVTLSDEQPFDDYFRELSRVPKLGEVARRHAKPASDAELAFAMELVLEALHQGLRLSREDLDSTITFTELMKFNILRTIR